MNARWGDPRESGPSRGPCRPGDLAAPPGSAGIAGTAPGDPIRSRCSSAASSALTRATTVPGMGLCAWAPGKASNPSCKGRAPSAWAHVHSNESIGGPMARCGAGTECSFADRQEADGRLELLTEGEGRERAGREKACAVGKDWHHHGIDEASWH